MASIPKNEASAVLVPAVEVLGLGEVGVASEEERAEAGLATQGDGSVEKARGQFVGGAVAAPVGQEQGLGGVGQRDDQGVVTPGAVVGDVHARFALGVGGDEGAVGVDCGLVEERGGLLRPDALPGLVDRVHQVEDVTESEASAEVARGRGVGNPHGAQGVEIDLIITPQFEVLDLCATGKDVEGEVDDVVGFVIGEVAFEEVEVVIDIGDETCGACDQEHGADATGGQSLDTIGQFVVDVVGGDHRAFPLGAGPILDATEESSLALPEFVEDIGVHSKASDPWNSEDVLLP